MSQEALVVPADTYVSRSSISNGIPGNFTVTLFGASTGTGLFVVQPFSAYCVSVCRTVRDNRRSQSEVSNTYAAITLMQLFLASVAVCTTARIELDIDENVWSKVDELHLCLECLTLAASATASSQTGNVNSYSRLPCFDRELARLRAIACPSPVSSWPRTDLFGHVAMKSKYDEAASWRACTAFRAEWCTECSSQPAACVSSCCTIVMYLVLPFQHQ
jgi:hypothetical protein